MSTEITDESDYAVPERYTVPREDAEVRPGDRAPIPISVVPIVIDYNDVRATLDEARRIRRVDRHWRGTLLETGLTDRLRDWRAMMWEKANAGDRLAQYFTAEIDRFIVPEELK